MPAAGWELLVIDSACSDGTAAWLAEALPRLPVPARALREAEPGVARARNRALAEAAAPLLLFLDDDCTAAPGWGLAHRAAFADPAVWASGGRIEPVVPASTAAWMVPFYTRRHGGPGGRFDMGPAPCALPLGPGGDLPFGANCALRVAAARAIGGFDRSLGWGGPENLPGEETDLMERLLAAGGRIAYRPEALVRHHLPSAAVTRAAFLRHFRATTRLQVRRERQRARRPRSNATLAYRALRFSLAALARRLLAQPAAALERQCLAIYWRARLCDRLRHGRPL